LKSEKFCVPVKCNSLGISKISDNLTGKSYIVGFCRYSVRPTSTSLSVQTERQPKVYRTYTHWYYSEFPQISFTFIMRKQIVMLKLGQGVET